MVRCTPPGATWPQYWTRGHADRAGLLAALEPFLTDDRRRFGAIVAPLVNGLRVRGAFAPSWNGQLPYLERWQAEPQRPAGLPAPASQFLGGGGRLAKQFVDAASRSCWNWGPTCLIPASSR